MSFYEAHKQTCRGRRDSGNCLLTEENSLLRERIAVLEKESAGEGGVRGGKLENLEKENKRLKEALDTLVKAVDANWVNLMPSNANNALYVAEQGALMLLEEGCNHE